MREIEDRRVWIGVDGDDQVGALHPDAMLDRARDPGGDVKFRTDRLAGLADLPVRRHPALLHQWPGTAPLTAQYLRQRADELQVFRRPQAEPAGDDDFSIRQLRFL